MRRGENWCQQPSKMQMKRMTGDFQGNKNKRQYCVPERAITCDWFIFTWRIFTQTCDWIDFKRNTAMRGRFDASTQVRNRRIRWCPTQQLKRYKSITLYCDISFFLWLDMWCGITGHPRPAGHKLNETSVFIWKFFHTYWKLAIYLRQTVGLWIGLFAIGPTINKINTVNHWKNKSISYELEGLLNKIR